jgi:ACT domain-containing protein
MKLDITRVDVWAATIKDRPGGLARKLETLAKAGVNLEFVIARRRPEKPGAGVVFVTPIKGARQTNAAKKAGFKKAKSLHGLRVAGPDKPGLGAILTGKVAEAKINIRGLSAAAIGRRSVCNFAFDSAQDAAGAVRCLKQL